MGGPGNWTLPVYFLIPEQPSALTPGIIGGLIAGVIIIIAISLTAIYVVKKR